VDWIRTQADIRDYFEEAQRRLNELQVVVQRAKALS
jgi:hypothetical protein